LVCSANGLRPLPARRRPVSGLLYAASRFVPRRLAI
jgi:hypothetical protein